MIHDNAGGTPARAGNAFAIHAQATYVCIAAVAALISVYAMRRVDPDLWGYLTYGRLFLDKGLTDRDFFSYTCRSCTWIHFEYLSQISLWLAYVLTGVVGLIVLKCVVGGFAVYFVFRTLRMVAPNPSIWLPVYLLVLGIVPRFFLFRPQLYTFAFFAFFVDTLFRFLLRGGSRLWPLVPLTALWANFHGGVLAGLGVIALAGFLKALQQFERSGRSVTHALGATRVLSILFGACVAATMVNPQGWRLWTYLLTELTHDTNRRFIEEWMPLSFARDPWSATAVVLLAVAILGATVLSTHARAFPGGLRPWQWAVSCLPLLLMTLRSARHVPILTIWATPVLAVLVDSIRWNEPWKRRVFRGAAVAFAIPCILTAAVVAVAPQPRISIPPGALGRTEPFGAVRYLQTHAVEGNLYLPLWWGSYVTWELYPRVLVSMDGRNVSMYPTEMVRENLLFYKTEAGDVEAPLRYTTDLLLVPRDAHVLRGIRRDFRWIPVFEDSDCVLFVRSGTRAASSLSLRPEGSFDHASNRPSFLY